MMQSAFRGPGVSRTHIAIIMDGNGRWATRRGLPREEGHRAGAQAVHRVVEAARELGICQLTLFAFSSANWQRPTREVENLMRIYEAFFREEREKWVTSRIRVNVIGRRDRLPPSLREAIEEAETKTAKGLVMHLRFALDYSGRDAILRAAHRMNETTPSTAEAFSRLLAESTHADRPVPDIDLIVRSGGEQRVSDFMLWESAYAELVFTDRLWPDFAASDLRAALEEFRHRERRFGRIPDGAIQAGNG